MNPSEEQEFRTFVAARSQALLHTAYLLTGNAHDAQDLLQTALLAVARSWTRVRRRDQPEPYVRQAMYRHQVNRWRRRARRPEAIVADPPERSTRGDLEGESILRQSILQALSSLPARQRAVVVLRYYEDLPEADVAGVLGVSVGTVRSQASRALAKLREHYPSLELEEV